MALKPGRIACINPRCRRTAPAERYPESTAIMCGKCKRSLPWSMRERWRVLKSRQRHIERCWRRRIAHGDVAPDQPAPTVVVERAILQLWDEFERYFKAPEKPAGLDGFLQEVGLA